MEGFALTGEKIREFERYLGEEEHRRATVEKYLRSK